MARKSSKNDRARGDSLARQDGWNNVLTALGSKTRDKRESHIPVPEPLSYADALSIYRASDTAARIVDVPAEEMLRQGFEIKIPEGHEESEAIVSALDDLEVDSKLLDLAKKTRAFGGAVALIGAQDGATGLSKPLNENGIRSIDFLTVFDPSEVSVLEFVGAPGDRNYGEPAMYSIHPKVLSVAPKALGLERVHASRVLHFRGPSISRLQEQANRGFGDSVFDLVWKVVRNFDTAHENAHALVEDFAQAVFKIKGLAEAIAGDRADVVKKRLEIMDLSRSVLRGIALDGESEDFERKPTPISGLADLLDRFAQRLSAATRIPVTVLMGQSPAGLNATGASDIRIFYDFIASQQNAILKKPLERFVRLLMLSKKGPTKGIEADNWCVEFRPLWQPSEQEQAQTRQTIAQADQVYLTNGVVSADEVRKARFGGDKFSVDTSIDDDNETENEASDLADEEGVTREVDAEGNPIQVKPGETVPASGSSGAPGAPSSGGAPKVQDQAMNGAQVTSLIEVVRAYHAEEIPRESALAIVRIAFRLTDQEASDLIGPENFQPKEPPAPVIAPGIGGKPGAPEQPKQPSTPRPAPPSAKET